MVQIVAEIKKKNKNIADLRWTWSSIGESASTDDWENTVLHSTVWEWENGVWEYEEWECGTGYGRMQNGNESMTELERNNRNLYIYGK